ncbi:hypothetical protein HDV04_000251 [Boothiomyces sp. JEL0838]|nr:hypothetical protein HDV04_000251 [Boothiomyces sp. JEL0838]
MNVNMTANSVPINDFRISYNTTIRSTAPRVRPYGSTRANIPSMNVLTDSMQAMKIKRNSRRRSLTKKDGLPKIKVHTKNQTYSITVNPGDSVIEIKSKLECLLGSKELNSLFRNEGEKMVPISEGDFNDIDRLTHLYSKE